jgi:rhodanese-related sulfurtransferase
MAISSITASDAEALVETGGVTVLDVRTSHEFATLGHIPGAWLLPVDLVAAGPAILPGGGRPVLVCCEHGVRSVAAAHLLERAGVDEVVNLAGGMSQWTGPREFGSAPIRGPAGWLLHNADELTGGGRVLDIACGRGRHALPLGAAGFEVHAVDRDPEAIHFLASVAKRLGLPVHAETIDLEAAGVDLGRERYDVVVVFNYLHRPLIPAIVRALEPGGVLFYETFTVGQAQRGRPTNPAFLLKDGELPGLVAPLVVERSREGDADGKLVASVIARKART